VEVSGNGTFLKLWDSLHWDVRGRIALRRLAARGAGLSRMIALHGNLMDSLREGRLGQAIEQLTVILQTISAAFEPI
jgi:DNA-binding GntR family transcriptional regulator